MVIRTGEVFSVSTIKNLRRLKMIDDELEKKIRLAGERARMVAKIKGIPVVYEDNEGWMVYEYPDGKIERIRKMEDENG
jgi:hypothetical protein